MEKPKREEVRRHIQNLAGDYKCWDERLSHEEALVLCDMLDKLAEYEDLDEQGKLLELLCAVGDTVYTLNPLQSGKIVIGETTADAFMCALGMLEGRFGKTIFLTQEEAEAALKEL